MYEIFKNMPEQDPNDQLKKMYAQNPLGNYSVIIIVIGIDLNYYFLKK